MLGNNMFAYCLNNPVNLIDPSGTIPFADDFFSETFAQIGEWIGNTLRRWWNQAEIDESSGNITNSVKVKNTIESVVRNLEFSAGLGQGIYAEFEVCDLSASIGMYGNYGTINYQDGRWFTGKEIHTGASLSFTQFLEFGFSDDICQETGKAATTSSWSGMNTTQESFTFLSAGCYPLFFGASVRIGFDVLTFLDDLDSIWR